MTRTSEPPKALLYTWPMSVWSTVPQLCLQEKGYSDDEYVVKHVDIGVGENFAPSYLRINHNGTIPTLVVPTLESTSADVETRYRSLRDTKTICDFLDQARSSANPSSSGKPAPALAPATLKSDLDPNFLNMSARDEAELKIKSKGYAGRVLSKRKANLEQYVAEAQSLAANSIGNSFEQKMVAFLLEKQVANNSMYEIYFGEADATRSKAFFEAGNRIWTVSIPEVLKKLEGTLKGPYALGDQIALCDLHIVSWLTRIISVADGETNMSGLTSLEKQLGGYKFGPKLTTFWKEWTARDSYRKVLVPAAKVFLQSKAK